MGLENLTVEQLKLIENIVTALVVPPSIAFGAWGYFKYVLSD